MLEESIRLEVVERFCLTRRGFVLGLCSHALLADQVVAARTRFPGAELDLTMGSDKVVQLLDPKWYPNRARDAVLDALFVGARILYAARQGEEEVVRETLQRKENERWAGRIDRLDQVPPEVAAISSRSVRRRFRRGEEISHLVPPEVQRLLAHLDRYGGT